MDSFRKYKHKKGSILQNKDYSRQSLAKVGTNEIQKKDSDQPHSPK